MGLRDAITMITKVLPNTSIARQGVRWKSHFAIELLDRLSMVTPCVPHEKANAQNFGHFSKMREPTGLPQWNLEAIQDHFLAFRALWLPSNQQLFSSRKWNQPLDNQKSWGWWFLLKISENLHLHMKIGSPVTRIHVQGMLVMRFVKGNKSISQRSCCSHDDHHFGSFRKGQSTCWETCPLGWKGVKMEIGPTKSRDLSCQCETWIKK